MSQGAERELARELLEDPRSPAPWKRLSGASVEAREVVVDALKESLDFLVRSNPPAALEVAETMLRAARDLPSRVALALRGRAVATYFNGDAAKALVDFQAAVRHYEEDGEKLDAARVRRSMVDVYQFLGRCEESLACAEAARAVFVAEGERRLLAQLEVNVGNVFIRLDDYPQARVAYGKARELFIEIKDEVGLAFAEFSLANLERTAYRFESAEQAYRSARAVWERVGMDIHVADCDFSLAYMAAVRGRFAEALLGLEEVREVYAREGKATGVPLCDLHLAETYLRIDANRDALDRARAAAQAYEAMEFDYELGKALMMMSMAAHRLGDHREALTNADRAASCFLRLGNHTLHSHLEIQRATIQLDTGDAAGALERVRSAAQRVGASGHRLLADLGAIALARALTAVGDAEEALRVLAPLTSSAAEPPRADPLLLAEPLRAVGAAEAALGHRDAAIRALERAVEAADRSYAQVPGSDLRIAFFRGWHGVFVDLALLLTEEDASPGRRPDAAGEALRLLERSRARSAFEEPPENTTLSAEALRARERLDELLGARLDAELGSLSDAAAPKRTPPSDEELREARAELDRRLESRPSDAPAAVARFGAREQRLAIHDGEVVLSYLVTRERAQVFVVEPERTRVVPLEVSREQLAGARDRLALQLQKTLLGASYFARHERRLIGATQRILDELGEALLTPALPLIEGRDVIVVPYGELHGLPFHALRAGGRYLIEDRDVSFAPSLRILSRCRAASPASSTSGRGVLAAGAEEAGLDAIEQELAALRTLYGARLERIPPGELAGRLRESGAEAALLHIASHGRFERTNPRFSGVRLGDTFLTVHDIRRMRLDIDLVVLSGCETARHATLPGEELFGPEQALFAAGARSVVAAMWRVGDESTARFMKSFYERLARAAPVRRALAETLRETSSETPHPLMWAPFALSGDPDVRCPAPGA